MPIKHKHKNGRRPVKSRNLGNDKSITSVPWQHLQEHDGAEYDDIYGQAKRVGGSV